MDKAEYQFSFEVYQSINDLPKEDAMLLNEAIKATSKSYAPYSRFRVAAVARLSDERLVTGTNQENASFPAGICAERVLMSAISALHPQSAVEAIAITYDRENGPSNHPISPCGICRQTLLEYEERMKSTIRLILGGKQGQVYVIPRSSFLMPLAFTGDELK